MEKNRTGGTWKAIAGLSGVMVMVVLAVALAASAGGGGSDPAYAAATHDDPSVNVAVVGSPAIKNGGTLPTSGGGFSAFSFSNVSVAGLSLAALGANGVCGVPACDTLVLNVASSTGAGGLQCNTGNLSASQKTDIDAFVKGGGKLIIYDSECTFGGSVDYQWLQFPFSTTNPGALGATGGTLNVIEENSLSSNLAGPHFIDTAAVTTTDAVGDMNVVDLNTVDPNWGLDMTGTNANNNSGAVHMCARSGDGVYIYNGLDIDFIVSSVGASGGGQLAKIWLHELESSISDPTDLPCAISISAIDLSPQTDKNEVGTTHTVEAFVREIIPPPPVAIVGVVVTFEVVSGPNAGTSGTCSPNANCTSDANGLVSFAYLGDGGVGKDIIRASFIDGEGNQVFSDDVSKQWNPPPVLDEQINIHVNLKTGGKLEGTCWRISSGPAKVQHDVVGDDTGGVKPDCGEPSNVKLFDEDPAPGVLLITITSAQRVQFGDIWHVQHSFSQDGNLDSNNFRCDLSQGKCTIPKVAVGGLSVDLAGDETGLPLQATRSSGGNAGVVAAALAAVATGAVTLGGAAWYARRRWLR